MLRPNEKIPQQSGRRCAPPDDLSEPLKYRGGTIDFSPIARKQRQ